MQNVDRETREATERRWYRMLAAALMVVLLASGAYPLVKNALFPVVRNR